MAYTLKQFFEQKPIAIAVGVLLIAVVVASTASLPMALSLISNTQTIAVVTTVVVFALAAAINKLRNNLDMIQHHPVYQAGRQVAQVGGQVAQVAQAGTAAVASAGAKMGALALAPVEKLGNHTLEQQATAAHEALQDYTTVGYEEFF